MEAEMSPDDEVWRLATALSGAASSGDVALALAQMEAAAGAAFANLAVVDLERDVLRVVHGSVLDPAIATRWAEFPLSERTPLCEVVETNAAVLLGSIDAIGERYPNLHADALASGLYATASLPLRAARGTVLGAVEFGWKGPQGFDATQARRLDLIAAIAAQALDRALLYERERVQISAREDTEAHLLQEAFLPRVLPHIDNLELAAAYLPARDATMGGDWYDAFAVDGGTCLVIGDVAGHGVQAAAVMAQLRNAVRAFADEDPSPERVLTRLNRMQCRLEPDETATAIVALWDPATSTIFRSTAGHPPVLRCRAGEFDYLVPPFGGTMLGADPTCMYRAEAKVLRPGTTLLFYTDGLVEIRGRTIEEGMYDLRMFVENLADLSPQHVCDKVLEWRLNAERQEDDICLLAARLS
ncbi:MAG: PP2C family protein-serine/threonine phosphatase [Acidimicrobiales bacterium]